MIDEIDLCIQQALSTEIADSVASVFGHNINHKHDDMDDFSSKG